MCGGSPLEKNADKVSELSRCGNPVNDRFAVAARTPSQKLFQSPLRILEATLSSFA